MRPEEVNWHSGHKVDLLVPSDDGTGWWFGMARVLKAPPRRVLLQTTGAFSPLTAAAPKLTHGVVVINPRNVDDKSCAQPVVTRHGAIGFSILWADGAPVQHLQCTPGNQMTGVFVNPQCRITPWTGVGPHDIIPTAEDLVREDSNVVTIVGSHALGAFFAVEAGQKDDWSHFSEIPRELRPWIEREISLAQSRAAQVDGGRKAVMG